MANQQPDQRDPDQPDTVVYTDVDAIVKLAELGLSEDALSEVVTVANVAHANCTAFHPKSAPGFYLWAEGVNGLRLLLVPQGWLPEDDRGYPVIVHPSRTHALSVAGGDGNTGNPDPEVNPRTQSDKGAATQDAVSRNQYSFWHHMPTWFPESLPVDSAPVSQTWILLIHVDKEAELVKSELSLPSSMSSDGHIRSWRERIILASVPYGGGAVEWDDGEGDDDQEIDVERRTA